MDTNPYQAPPLTTESIPMATLVGPVHYSYVDGDALVVPSGTVLPPICIKTNQPVSDRDVKTQTTFWCTPWIFLLLLIGPLPLCIGYFVVRKKCSLKFGLQPQIRKRYRNRVLLKSLIAFGLFFGMLFSTAYKVGEITLALAILFLIALIVACVGNSPISIKTYKDGAFWVKGCSPEFLRDIQQ